MVIPGFEPWSIQLQILYTCYYTKPSSKPLDIYLIFAVFRHYAISFDSYSLNLLILILNYART